MSLEILKQRYETLERFYSILDSNKKKERSNASKSKNSRRT